MERYFEANTTLKEEQILKAFFSQDDVEIPVQLLPYKDLFTALEPNEELDNSFDERILSITEGSVKVKARTISLTDHFRPLFRAAAAVAILLTLSTALNQSFKSGDVWTDEEQFADYKAAIQKAALAAAEDSMMLLTEGIAGRTDSLVVDSLYKPTGYLE